MAHALPPLQADDVALRQLIGQEIAATGPMSFARFMHLALLHPDHGYYATRAGLGRGGDFITAPELHPAFATCLARQALQVWQLAERPRPFVIQEFGPGTGALARDLLVAAQAWPEFAAAVEYVLTESSTLLRQRQRDALAGSGAAIRWSDTPVPGVGLVIANEFLDALPVHRVTLVDGELRELQVTRDGDDLVEVTAAPTTPALATYLAAGGVALAEGQVADINLGAPAWLAEVAAGLQRGAVLVIDYGDETAPLYGPRRRRGTLLCYQHHRVHEDPFVALGQQDITSHVDFGALARQAAACGLHAEPLTTQGAFLAGLALEETLLHLQRVLPPADYVRQRQAVADLIRPDRLGGFKVWLAHRGLPVGAFFDGLRLRL